MPQPRVVFYECLDVDIFEVRASAYLVERISECRLTNVWLLFSVTSHAGRAYVCCTLCYAPYQQFFCMLLLYLRSLASQRGHQCKSF